MSNRVLHTNQRAIYVTAERSSKAFYIIETSSWMCVVASVKSKGGGGGCLVCANGIQRSRRYKRANN